MRELYIYWKLAPGDETAARAALTAWQQALRSRFPGLQPRVLRRADDAGGPRITLMEVYAQPPAGISDAALDAIRSEGDGLLAPWCAGGRHLEIFAAEPHGAAPHRSDAP